MQIFTKTIDGPEKFTLPEGIKDQSGLLFVDIETTGLSPKTSCVCLIGCAWYAEDSWKMIQWLDDTGEGEKEILTSFVAFTSSFSALVHYNGERFDIPFMKERMQACGISADLRNALDVLPEVDLYRILRPYKHLIAPDNYRQETLEAYFGFPRKENMTGKEAVGIYRAWLSGHSKQLLEKYLSHNEADLTGLLKLHPILAFTAASNTELTTYKAQAGSYTDVSGARREELILFSRAQGLDENCFPFTISAASDGCYLTMQGNRVTLKIPIVTAELKYFYANYKDYYYLPAEDQAMHKSIAAFVEKSHRVQAKADNCYTKKRSSYLPQWSAFKEPFFKKDYHDRELYFELTDELKNDRAFFSRYAEYVFRHILHEGKA